MAKTRAAHRRSASARRSYRRRVKGSHCRGKGPAACRGASGCKPASGRKRSFCRKSKNTKRHRGGKKGHKKGHKKSHKNRKHKGRGVVSSAVVPFGLWGAKYAFSNRK